MDEPRNGEIAVSLVVATVGRTQELSRMLASIDRQSLKGIELIIVDQNTDDRVEKLLEAWKETLTFRHVRSPKGLSRARNAGIKLASGPIICFPDDDCWYPDNLLEHVSKWFDRHQAYDFLCCTAQDGSGREVASRWPSHSLNDRSQLGSARLRKRVFVHPQRSGERYWRLRRKDGVRCGDSISVSGGQRSCYPLHGSWRKRMVCQATLRLSSIQRGRRNWRCKGFWIRHGFWLSPAQTPVPSAQRGLPHYRVHWEG